MLSLNILLALSSDETTSEFQRWHESACQPNEATNFIDV